MATEALISWKAPTHFYVEKKQDWYWVVGIITLAITAVCIMFGQIIPAIFVVVAAVALVLIASRPPHYINCEINDRGIVVDKVLYPFLSLDAFWIPHDEPAPKLLLKSRKLLMPLFVIYIEEVDPEAVREILLKYIAETEQREPFLKHVLERFGF